MTIEEIINRHPKTDDCEFQTLGELRAWQIMELKKREMALLCKVEYSEQVKTDKLFATWVEANKQRMPLNVHRCLLRNLNYNNNSGNRWSGLLLKDIDVELLSKFRGMGKVNVWRFTELFPELFS